MEITKGKVKRSAAVTALTAGGLEYVSAAVIHDLPLFVHYEFDRFREALYYNLSHPISTFSNVLSTEMFTQIQPVIIGGSLFLGGKVLLQKLNTYEDASDYGAYGTARFAKDHEIFDKEDITTNVKREGTIIGTHKGKTLIHHTDSYLNRNILLVGGSGAGKTRSNIIPNILKNKEKSIVVVDPKGELYEKTSQVKREQGYEVHLVNFKNRDISDRYNLFDYLRRDSDAFKVADSMVSNAGEGSKVNKDFWNQKQIAVLQALFLYVKYALPKNQRHMGSVMAMAGLPEDTLKNLFREFPTDHIVYIAFATAIEQLKDKTLADVFATMTNTLNPWLYQDVCDFTSANDFMFEDLGTKKMIVYVIMPIADNEFMPLITTFFTQMFSELYLLADKNMGRLPKDVILLLDEFANIGKIPNFHKRLSTTRSLGIDVTVVLQDISQLDNVYGKDIAKEIFSNCDIRILLKANENESAKYFSQQAGKTTIRIKNSSSSSSSGKSSSKSESVNYLGRDLITADEVMRLKRNEQLLFIAGHYPMKIKKAWFDELKSFKHLLLKTVSRDDYPVADRGQYSSFNANQLVAATAELPADLPQELNDVLMFNLEPEEENKIVLVKDESSSKKIDYETGEILEEQDLGETLEEQDLLEQEEEIEEEVDDIEDEEETDDDDDLEKMKNPFKF